MSFYKCDNCGSIVESIGFRKLSLTCCAEPMTELKPNTVDAAKEKHIPLARVDGNIVTVSVGSVPHPMGVEHNISWVAITTNMGSQRKFLEVDGKPETTFSLVDGERLESVYAYCNLHGLWVNNEF